MKRSGPAAYQAPYTIFTENNTSVFFVDMPPKINQKKTIKIEILGAHSVSGQNLNGIQSNFLKYQAALNPNFVFGAQARFNLERSTRIYKYNWKSIWLPFLGTQ